MNAIQSQRDQLLVELASEKEHNKSLMKEIQDIRKDRDLYIEELKK